MKVDERTRGREGGGEEGGTRRGGEGGGELEARGAA